MPLTTSTARLPNTRALHGAVVVLAWVLAIFCGPALDSAWAATAPKSAIADAAGDTFGEQPTQLDLASLEVGSDGSRLVAVATFHGPVTPADSGAADALAGFLDLDTDQNPLTGTRSTVDAYSHFIADLGVDFFVDLGSYSAATGEAPVFSTATGVAVGAARLQFASTRVLVDLPLALLDDDGNVDAALLVGTAAEPTDTVPNGGFLTSDEGTLRLRGDRFAVRVDWRDFQGTTGIGHARRTSADDSGLFWFFGPANLEMLVKVLDGCSLNQRFWVFAAATTTVEYTLTVTDTATGAQKQYRNPLGTAAPALTDTSAFATCP